MRPTPARRAARIAGTALAAAVSGWLLSSAVVVWKLTRRARPPFPEPIPTGSPEGIEPVRLRTSDGEELGAWFLPSPGADISAVVLHGNSGSRASEIGLLRELSDEHVSALAPTLRAHGDSTGSTNDFGWGARADVIASVAFLERRLPGTRILVLGNSLGAAAAIYAAKELDHRVETYVLESPYRDLRSAARHRLAVYLPPPLDDVAYAGMRLVAPVMLAPSLDDLSPIDRITDIPTDVPVVFLSGTEDRLAPISELEEIQSRRAAASRLVAFPGGRHHDLAATHPTLFAATLREVLAEARQR